MAENLTINLETEHLILRQMRPEDVTQDYVNWLNDPEINRYLSCAHSRQTMASCLAYVRAYAGCHDKSLIGIFLKEKDLHLGNLTLSTIDWQNRSATIGISLGRKEYMGKGLAFEALSALLWFCFQEIGLNRLQAGVHVENSRSVALFKKCGFQIEGILKESGFLDGKYVDGYWMALLNRNIK
jgi:[ribosomal protein S5]-alanine N-acetyltransferase